MDEIYFRRVVTLAILLSLLVLSLFLLKPILISIISGLLLAFIFTPAHNWLYGKTKLKNLSASLICIFLIFIIVLPFWFLTPIVVDQSFKMFQASQQIDFIEPLKAIFPSLFASDEFSAEVGSILHSFVIRLTNSLVNLFSLLILNFPTLFLQFLVALFIFFFALRDGEKLLSYLRSFSPFSSEIEKKLFSSSKEITFSIIYGQVIVGIIQGIIVGIGFFIFNVPNALLLSLFACLAGIFPIIGTTIIWAPVVIYLFVAGNIVPAIGISVFGLFSSSIDNLLKPIIIARRTNMHSSLILLGMIGGLFLFGILGFILGPLILAYFFIILEIYKIKSKSIFIKGS